MDVVGNKEFVEMVQILKDDKPFPHTLILGPSGAGKTTLGKYIAEVTKTNIQSYYAPDVDKFYLQMIIGGISAYDVIIMDEIHNLRKGLLEILYQPIEDGKYQGKKLPPFTFIGITTELNSLPDALIRRFRLVHRVQLYNDDELMQVLLGLNNKEIEDDAIEAIAHMSRGSPGIARNHLEIVEKLFKNSNEIIYEDILKYQHLKHINDIGLEDIDMSYLTALRDYGTISLSTMSSILIEREKAIEYNIEPFLFRIGLVLKTSKGRQLTPKGRNYISEY